MQYMQLLLIFLFSFADYQMGDTKPTLYFDPNQTQSRRVLIALEDLGFDCHLVILDELLGENLSKSWFTQLGTQGRFPCLTTGISAEKS